MLVFWWHINPHVAYKKLMLQGYFLIRDHIYICDKFVHGPTEKDEDILKHFLSLFQKIETLTFLANCLLRKKFRSQFAYVLRQNK